MQSPVLIPFALLAASGAAAAQSPLEVKGLREGVPLTISASATEGALFVDLVIEDEWHAYSRYTGGGGPVKVSLEGSCDFAATGPLDAPGNDEGELEGAVRLTLPIEPVGEGRELRATFDFQVCDALECLEPMSVEIAGEVRKLSVLLVVAEEGERADRIAGWMRDRDLAVDVTTYAGIQRPACESHDVVVADSGLFQKHGVSRDDLARFPKTDTPTVAVGYLGTQLVENHGVAMTSGYI